MKAEERRASVDSEPVDPSWAWSRYLPDQARPWDRKRAGHLLRRAGFGADAASLARALADGPKLTVERLLRPDANLTAFDAAYDRYETASAGGESTEGLRAWWLRRMMETPHPLLEKMTLFWHGHFAIAGERVKSGKAMLAYVRTLRDHALGSFAELLAATSRDPAILVGAGSRESRKARPSREYPRLLLELHTLGSGNFTERDLAETARALTGRFVIRDELRHVPREHDASVKTILGETGEHDSEAVIKILLKRPATARAIVRKVFRELVSDSMAPSDELLEPLARSFGSDYDIARLVETVLLSNIFFSGLAYRQRIKSPVELAIGLVRSLEGRVGTAPLGSDLEALGQSLYAPPTVEGWPRGRDWINRFTMLKRTKLVAALFSDSGRYESQLDPREVVERHQRGAPGAARAFLVDLLLDGELDERVVRALPDVAAGESASRELRMLARTLATLPEFHVA